MKGYCYDIFQNRSEYYDSVTRWLSFGRTLELCVIGRGILFVLIFRFALSKKFLRRIYLLNPAGYAFSIADRADTEAARMGTLRALNICAASRL